MKNYKCLSMYQIKNFTGLSVLTYGNEIQCLVWRGGAYDSEHGYVECHCWIESEVRICTHIRRSHHTGCMGQDPTNIWEFNMGPAQYCVAKY